jgi:thioredoxin 1
MSQLRQVTDATFEEEVEQAVGLTLVDFWAPWCPPCRVINPILEQLAEAHGDGVKIVKLDTDSNVRTMSRYNVRSLPTLLLFRDGKVADQIVGAVPRERIEALLTGHQRHPMDISP